MPIRGHIIVQVEIVIMHMDQLGKVLDFYMEGLQKRKYMACVFFSWVGLQHISWTHYLFKSCMKDHLYPKVGILSNIPRRLPWPSSTTNQIDFPH